MGTKSKVLLLAGVMAVLSGCGIGAAEPKEVTEREPVEINLNESTGIMLPEETGMDLPSVEPEKTEEEAEKVPVLVFRDAFGEEYETEILTDISPNPYENDKFVHEGDRVFYEDETYRSRIGIDVSKYQDKIDWEKVKAAGVEFVFIRIGFRGYGEEGKLMEDAMFEKHIRGAQEQGLDVGVYFFAQAVNEEEAREEAQFVIDRLRGYELQLPVVYDPETIRNDVARTDDVSGEQFTRNTQAFCEVIAEAGYQPMIYSNMVWEAFQFDLRELTQYPVWYADYETVPQTPYRFEIWQYSEKGQVDGIAGSVDMNLQLIPR